MELRKTPFYQKHLQNKARIVGFAGWALPVEYKSVLQEAKAVRSKCGIFDASHMGEIIVKGKGALEFLQRLTTNDISLIIPGQMQYNLFINQEAGIIDDFMLYDRGEDFFCVVNASNKQKVLGWFRSNLIPEVKIVDESDGLALLSVQGPNSYKIIKATFGSKFADLEYMHFVQDSIDNNQVLISRSGYTGEDGFEIYLNKKEATHIWDRLISEGKSFDLLPCGLGARDILRIEAGYPLYGHEINETTNPYEASLGWAVKLNKDSIAKETLLREKGQGSKRKRVGFLMQQRALAREGYPVYFDNQAIGKVCSGTYSPHINNFIGMAHVDKEYSRLDQEVDIKVREKLYKAKIVKFPFIKPKTKTKLLLKEVSNG